MDGCAVATGLGGYGVGRKQMSGARPERRRGDRASDAKVTTLGVTKPAILGRRTQRWLCVGVLTLILYGTVGPVAGYAGPWFVPPAHWSWTLAAQSWSANDALTNLVVYIPVGVALRLLLRRRGMAAFWDLSGAIALACCLSYLAECVQQAVPARCADLHDVYTNAAGATLGVLIATPVQRWLRAWHALVFLEVRKPEERWRVLAWTAAVGFVLVMTVPWVPAPPAWSWGFDRPLAVPDWQRALLSMALGATFAGVQLVRPIAKRQFLRAVLTPATIVVATEAAQIVLAAHTACLRDVCVGVAGALAGVALAALGDRAWRARTCPLQSGVHTAAALQPRWQWGAATGLILALAYIVYAGLNPDGAGHGFRSIPRVNWLPLAVEFQLPFARQVAVLAEPLLIYGATTLLCLLLAGSVGAPAALLLLLATVGGVQMLQAFLVGHTGDTTPLLLVVVAWLIVVRSWSALRPRAASARRDSDLPLSGVAQQHPAP